MWQDFYHCECMEMGSLGCGVQEESWYGKKQETGQCQRPISVFSQTKSSKGMMAIWFTLAYGEIYINGQGFLIYRQKMDLRRENLKPAILPCSCIRILWL